MSVCMICIHAMTAMNNNTVDFILGHIPYQCMMCCDRNVTKLYPKRNASEWQYIRTQNVSLLFPECHASSLCDECIMKICCHSNEFMRQCPECRRVIDPKYYKQHNITIPPILLRDNAQNDSDDTPSIIAYSYRRFQTSRTLRFGAIQLLLLVVISQILLYLYYIWIVSQILLQNN